MPEAPAQQPIKEIQLQYWNAEGTVSHYSYDIRPAFLYPPELHLLELFRDCWPRVRMLDIGVGGGRTTQYFAALAEVYVGLDFSPRMVERCLQKFASRWPHASVSFQHGDATDLREHEDGSYDLVLFSFNGVDNLPLEERQKALQEMKRVCKPGGWVVFSSHNAYNIPLMPRFRFQRHPMRLIEEMTRWRQVRQKNPPMAQVMSTPYVCYFDATVGDNLHLFARAEVQTQDLLAMGFSEVRRYASTDGRALLTEQDGRQADISWVYYYCRKP